ncbi:MAG: putative O-glycosylation ligase, exosortase A system-associated [Pseudomonadota bacterium]
MRDVVLAAALAAALGLALRYPFVGVLTWAWFTLMTPHQLAYGVYGVPINLVIAAVTIGSLIVNGGFRNARIDATTILMLTFAAWLTIAQVASLDGAASAEFYDRFIKTIAFAVVVLQATSTRLRLHAVLWTIVIALGFFAVKGALFTLATLGAYRVQGLETTILEDNNHMGIVLATSLPLILYLRGRCAGELARLGLAALFGLTIIAIIGTHSRGAFLSLVAFCGFYWLQSRHKAVIAVALLALTAPAIAFMPAKWSERMTTITTAGEDASFMGRVDAWIVNAKLAQANPLTGAGLRNSYQPEIAARVDARRAPHAKAAHSIYFEILGGAGVVGLAIYLSLFATAFLTAGSLAQGALTAGASWRADLGHYLRLSLAVFCIGGASVSLEMWDGYWLVIALIAAAARMPQGAPDIATPAGRPARGPRWRAGARGKAPA